jgi:hypothetical protein
MKNIFFCLLNEKKRKNKFCFFFLQMANHKWDLKSNYMLAFTVCKYGINPERWNLVANDLVEYIKITPQVKIKSFRSN